MTMKRPIDKSLQRLFFLPDVMAYEISPTEEPGVASTYYVEERRACPFIISIRR